MKFLLTLSCMMITASVFAASYEVPVKAGLEEYSIFELTGFKKKVYAEKLTIKYYLPFLLTGKSERIKLEGYKVPGSTDIVLLGDKAVATCSTLEEQIKCNIQYKNIEIDEAAATAAIDAVSKTPAEKFGRLEVMRAFSNDPVGILTY